ncbi:MULTISPECIES: hypothetical protein [Streptomyces]|uniref:Uncharacterized protein n=2 Tax=Streptomyces TaxID=1883 RepID=A0A420V570_9ACTN|nr:MULTISPECIES: hypothetical protein [Streptomyces]KNE80262.1 hypothetical protein ADZ36_23130 [Streptomyces fradiae]OFA46608.1 hypothetical protein BEN35_21195 [Streptomyces fradiae]PQM22488.1 hypothetical protein Sfr7A_16300 [Streptomyces xinghaiensis]RKM96545.1 hypothetical protein SFRA_010805 [Streptomyces xinghaiensis]RNC74303.1 hypothetical protein DC095_011340 [Streptomyces xinghaiensis]
MRLAALVTALTAVTALGPPAAHTAAAQEPRTPAPAHSAARAAVLPGTVRRPPASDGSFRERYREDGSPAARRLAARTLRAAGSRAIATHLPRGAHLREVPPMTVWRARDDGSRVARVAYTGTAVPPSGLAAHYDAAGRLTGTVEHVFEERGETQGRVAVWRDGRQVLDAFVEHTPEPSSRSERFTDCTAERDVPGWVVHALATSGDPEAEGTGEAGEAGEAGGAGHTGAPGGLRVPFADTLLLCPRRVDRSR